MEQSEKNKIKYMPQHSPVWSSKYQPERDMSQAYWKYQRNNLTLPAVKNNRGMPSPTADSNYYLTTCKQHKHHSCPNSGYQKYSTVQNEPSRRCASPPIQSRHARTKLCADNVATVRKSRYKDEVEDEDNPKYVEDEQGNFTEDNIDDYVCDEAEDDQEETVDSADKDYDEQEADNEVYEESYTCPQLQRLQKRTNKPMSKLPQKSRAAEQQQLDMRRLRYQQPSRLQNIYQENLSTRYYHNDLETPDAVSEEEVIRPIPPKGSSKRSPMNYLQTWTQPRNSTNRYESSNSPTQPTRRARTRPEIESLLEPEPDSSKKCSRCGNSSNKKEPTTRKNVCRFQNHSNLPVKGAIGDEMNTDEQMYNRYNRHGPEGSSATCGIPRSAYYAMKPRRSKGSRLPLYEAPEDQDQRQLIDEITNDYISSTSRCPKEMPHVFRERTGHPMQMARGQNSTRFPSRYAD